MFDLTGKKIFVAGHSGMVGSATVRALRNFDCEIFTQERSELDLRDQLLVDQWMVKKRPDIVINCAAQVGGIEANSSYPADFIYNNISIQTNVIHSAYKNKVKKLLFLGSSCIYPKFSKQPILESELLTGSLEETNQWYAVAKIAGLKLCQAYRKQFGCDFISAMPTNLFGPGDNYNLNSAHVLPALLRKAHEAKKRGSSELIVWGTGSALREFLHVDDCADALVFLLQHFSDIEHVNVGVGQDISVAELASIICDVVGFRGKVIFDRSKPDGTPRKLLNVNKISDLGWVHKKQLVDGIEETYKYAVNSGEIAKSP